MLLHQEGAKPTVQTQTVAENMDQANAAKTVCDLNLSKPVVEQQTEIPAASVNAADQPVLVDCMCCCMAMPTPRPKTDLNSN